MRIRLNLNRLPRFGVGAAIIVVWGLATANGQQATERFIPLGQSPGLSDAYTYVGTIEAVDAENRSVRFSGAPEGRRVLVTDRTHIWLDRSASKETNKVGSFADLQAGLQAEIKYEDAEDRTFADWIKVKPNAAQ